jgi:hypothetical protein
MDNTSELKKKLEKEGEQKVKDLFKSKPLKKMEDIQDALLQIIKDGDAEFEKEVGRPMTYGEMREMYG